MAYELVYTSVPQGISPGSTGFCTVAYTNGLAASMVVQLESISAYKPCFPHFDARADQNPISFSHYIFTASGSDYHVLSRVCFYGLDYTKRSNKLAHHVLCPPHEWMPQTASPADFSAIPGFFRESWTGGPELFKAQKSLMPPASTTSGKCHLWELTTGDAGWAGKLAQSYLEHPERPCFVIFDPLKHQAPLQLVAEALGLLPQHLRWQVTYNTYLTMLPVGVRCDWRFCLPKADALKDARRIPGALVIDLTQPLGNAGEGLLINAARTGSDPFPAPQAQLEPIFNQSEHGKASPHRLKPMPGNQQPFPNQTGRPIPILQPVHTGQEVGEVSPRNHKRPIAVALVALFGVILACFLAKTMLKDSHDHDNLSYSAQGNDTSSAFSTPFSNLEKNGNKQNSNTNGKNEQKSNGRNKQDSNNNGKNEKDPAKNGLPESTKPPKENSQKKAAKTGKGTDRKGTPGQGKTSGVNQTAPKTKKKKSVNGPHAPQQAAPKQTEVEAKSKEPTFAEDCLQNRRILWSNSNLRNIYKPDATFTSQGFVIRPNEIILGIWDDKQKHYKVSKDEGTPKTYWVKEYKRTFDGKSRILACNYEISNVDNGKLRIRNLLQTQEGSQPARIAIHAIELGFPSKDGKVVTDTSTIYCRFNPAYCDVVPPSNLQVTWKREQQKLIFTHKLQPDSPLQYLLQDLSSSTGINWTIQLNRKNTITRATVYVRSHDYFSKSLTLSCTDNKGYHAENQRAHDRKLLMTTQKNLRDLKKYMRSKSFFQEAYDELYDLKSKVDNQKLKDWKNQNLSAYDNIKNNQNQLKEAKQPCNFDDLCIKQLTWEQIPSPEIFPRAWPKNSKELYEKLIESSHIQQNRSIQQNLEDLQQRINNLSPGDNSLDSCTLILNEQQGITFTLKGDSKKRESKK